MLCELIIERHIWTMKHRSSSFGGTTLIPKKWETVTGNFLYTSGLWFLLLSGVTWEDCLKKINKFDFFFFFFYSTSTYWVSSNNEFISGVNSQAWYHDLLPVNLFPYDLFTGEGVLWALLSQSFVALTTCLKHVSGIKSRIKIREVDEVKH